MNFDPKKHRQASKIVSYGMNKPVYNMRLYYDMYLPFRDTISVLITDEYEEKHSLYDKSGVYSIYKDNMCLYVGESDRCIRYRLYRWSKELLDRSREDESHPAARRARLDGISADGIFKIKYVSWEEIENNFGWHKNDLESIDEYIAYWLKSKYNTRTIPLYVKPKYEWESSLF
jgi:hypothetical protein